MKVSSLIIGFAALGLVAGGCMGGNDSGDVEKAKKASAEMPKSVDQLPSDMPPQAKAAAAGAMGASQGMSEQMKGQMDAQKAAMEKMKGGGR